MFKSNNTNDTEGISLVIPTYNENENIKELIPRVFNFLPKNSEIIVVDDDSPDKTWKTAEELSRNYPVKVIRRIKERGLGSAVVQGFKFANNSIIGVMDADLQHKPEDIPKILEEINNGADIVIGSRYINGGEIKNWSTKRKFISKGSRFLASTLIKKLKKIKDPLSGFFFMKRKVIEGIKLSPIGYKILLEIIAKGNYKNIREVPITFEERKCGETKFNLKEAKNFLIHLYKLSIAEKFFKFCLIGLIGVFVNLGLLYFLTDKLNIFYLYSAMISIETSIISNFILNDIWTFKDRKNGNIFVRLFKFNVVSIGGLFINIVVLYIFTEFFGIWYISSAIFGIISATIWNFFVNLKWTWNMEKKSTVP